MDGGGAGAGAGVEVEVEGGIYSDMRMERDGRAEWEWRLGSPR